MRSESGFSLLEISLVFTLVAILIAPGARRARTRASVVEGNMGMEKISRGLYDYRAMVGMDVFPPAGGVAQTGWSAWTDRTGFGAPNGQDNGLHACSVIWMTGSFYDDAGDSTPLTAVTIPTGVTHYDQRIMTSPVEAISEVPLDPFKDDCSSYSIPSCNQFDYFGLDLSGEFVLRSLGPDAIAAVGCERGGFNCGCLQADCIGLHLRGADKRRPFDNAFDIHFGCAGCESLAQALKVGTAVYSPTNGTDSSGDIWRLSMDPDGADLTGDGRGDLIVGDTHQPSSFTRAGLA